MPRLWQSILGVPKIGNIRISRSQATPMTRKTSPFTPKFQELPQEIPLFPLPGVAAMPGTQVPLNIFEPRYLRMVLDVLGGHRMLGLVQPEPNTGAQQTPPVYRTGTAGRITSFSETRDGRLMIVLTGVCRFHIREELVTDRPYRSAVADWSAFAADFQEDTAAIPDRDALFRSLRAYCNRKQVEIAWKDAEDLEDRALIDLLTVHLPLEVAEKQALIECMGCSERATLLQGLLEMNLEPASGRRDMRH
jgi:Lon protease-like protein